jgi:predicted patatin/cPLA2 family phospholipase
MEVDTVNENTLNINNNKTKTNTNIDGFDGYCTVSTQTEDKDMVCIETDSNALSVVEDKKVLIPTCAYDTLVISGGGIKGILTLGALQYAYDNYLLKEIKTYIGTSAGCIISFLLIIGYTPVEIIVNICTNRFMERLQNFNVVSMMNGLGAASYSALSEQLEKITIAKIGYLPTLNDLNKKYGKNLICCTYNLTKATSEYLSFENYPDLPCLTALRMTSNLPLIFEKYSYNASYYIDGGIADNFPIDIGQSKGEKVLGLYIYTAQENYNKIPDMDIVEYIYNLINIPSVQSVEYKIKLTSPKCKIVRLTYENIKMFNFSIDSKTKLDMFSKGYQQMRNTLEE